MNADSFQLPGSVGPVKAILRGMGRETVCELLLERRPLTPAEFLSGIRHAQLEWTLLRAPLNLPDGDYTVTTPDGERLRATRLNGFWIHHAPDAAQTAPEIRSSEASASGPEFFRKARRVAASILQFDERYGISILVFAALITYGLPTIVELVAARDFHLGLVTLIFGDLIGCACLATFLEMPVFGVALYLLLTAVEAWLYYTGALSPGHLAYFADLVPMVVVIRRIGRLRAAAHHNSGERFSS